MTNFTPPRHGRFRHEALLYGGEEQFLASTTSFIGEALAADEPILVAVSAAKIDQLRCCLGAEADSVHFADMAEVGQNPARIIPAWQEFITEHGDSVGRVRGIGEPIWAGRSPAELVEAQHHEALLNVAFADTRAFWLLCPYDTHALAPEVIAHVHRDHPFIWDHGGRRQSRDYRERPTVPFEGLLPEPPEDTHELAFDAGRLEDLRSFVSRQAAGADLGEERTSAIVLAVNEVATNSVRHGGGGGTLRVWRDGGTLVCEVHDQGHIQQRLLGREQPTTGQGGRRGLWVVNQLCDLVQVRSSPAGTVVRLHMRRI